MFAYIRTRKELLDSAGALFGMLQKGAIKPHISQRFPLREAAEAHRVLEARKTTGQLLLIP